MSEQLTIKRTNSGDADFQLLIMHLDHELWNELKEDQATYDQYNKVPDLNTALVIYENEKPVAVGCFKKYSDDTVEIKRMFVEKEHRGKGLSKLVLKELEDWAIESGFHHAILETSVHFKVARGLYMDAGYVITENYEQYKGLDESVCMKKELNPQPLKGSYGKQNESGDINSPFKGLSSIEYFDFEEDFVEKNIRCIPMIVRFKMDKAGIKLKLAEWSQFSVEERIELAKKSCSNEVETKQYNDYLAGLIKRHTSKEATGLAIDQQPGWANLDKVPDLLEEKLREFGLYISVEQWAGLTNLQRFALLKLCKQGHESKNFPKALKEFDLI